MTHSTALDQVTGTINFVDINAGDNPTVSTKFASFTYQNVAHTDITATLNALQLADIAAVEANITVVADPSNKNNGSATFTYVVVDGAFDFLAAGETLTLTYNALVDNNYLPSDQVTTVPFTIIITGTNDVPVITTGPQTVGFVGGKDTPGGTLAPNVPTSGTLVFTDADLTDTHTIVSTALTNASLAGPGAPTLDLATLEATFPGPLEAFEQALSASVTTDSTGTGTGAISWKLADLAAYLADIVPKGETLTLTYTVEVEDSQGAIATQNIIVTIAGNNIPVVTWIETTATAATDAAPGDWNGASNWETGTVPTASNDVIIVTNQVQPNTPFFPVTIKAAADGGLAAFAKSLTMNDFYNTHPELDNYNSLTIGGGLTLNVDTIIKNFGNISVGTLATLLGTSGLAEILDTSVLQNSGTINLAGGGDFIDQSSITNSGTIELSGGTLNVEVAIANSGGTLQVDGGTTLKLTDGAVVSKGMLTIGSNGSLDIAKGAVVLGLGVPDATLDGVIVGNSGTIEVGTPTTSGTVLTLDDGTSVTGGKLIIDAGNTLDIESSSGATLDGVTVTGSGTIQVDGPVPTAVTLVLDDGTSITGDALTVGSAGILEVKSAAGATLNDVLVTNGNIIEVVSGGILTLDGATIKNGNLTIGGGDTLDVESTSGSTLDGITVTGTGTTGPLASTIEIGATTTSGSILTLDDGTSINGGTLTISGNSHARYREGYGDARPRRAGRDTGRRHRWQRRNDRCRRRRLGNGPATGRRYGNRRQRRGDD